VNVNFNNFFTGTVDEFIIHDGAMSAQKVADRYSKATGIETVHTGTRSRTTLISVTTGRVVFSGTGCTDSVISGMAPGLYILVTDDGTHREVRKFVKK